LGWGVENVLRYVLAWLTVPLLGGHVAGRIAAGRAGTHSGASFRAADKDGLHIRDAVREAIALTLRAQKPSGSRTPNSYTRRIMTAWA